jgi:hypothetical protein
MKYSVIKRIFYFGGINKLLLTKKGGLKKIKNLNLKLIKKLRKEKQKAFRFEL